MNGKKTRVIRVAKQKGCCEVRIGAIEIEQAVMISSDGNMEKRVEARLGSSAVKEGIK